RSLLAGRAALLVIDDAWEPAHARALLVGGDRCRVLITTREAVVALAVGAAVHDLDVLDPDQAQALLSRRLRRDLAPDERGAAAALVQAVGRLPLALELAAAQVADGARWEELLADLGAESAGLEALSLAGGGGIPDEAEARHLSLRASFNLSL